jgi:hypothetical protein
VTSGQRPTRGCWPKAERLLEVEAEAILADPLDGRERAPDRHLGEITSALIEAGLIAAAAVRAVVPVRAAPAMADT